MRERDVTRGLSFSSREFDNLSRDAFSMESPDSLLLGVLCFGDSHEVWELGEDAL